MFKSIHEVVENNSKSVENNETIIEGAKFNIFDDFDMHKQRDRLFKLDGLSGVKDVFAAIRDFILCPFYKSDEIVDNAIQSILTVFLMPKYTDISLNFFPDEDDDEIVDLSDLIDPNLLYTEGFTKKFKKGISKATSTVAKAAAPIVQPVAAVAAPIVQPVAAVAVQATNTVATVAAPIVQPVAAVAVQATNTVAKAAAPIVQPVAAVAVQATNTVAKAAAPIVKPIAAVATKIGNRVAGGVSKIGKKKKKDKDKKKDNDNNKKPNLPTIPPALQPIRKEEKEKQIEQKIIKYTSKIKIELYNILSIPIVIHILYNLYYMFFFKDTNGFINIEQTYYEPYLKDSLNYFLGIVIKPLTWLWYMLNSISTSKFIHSFSDNYPYVFYILLYIILYLIIKTRGTNIMELTRDLLFGNVYPFLEISTIIMVYEFLKAFAKETMTEWVATLAQQPISGSIKWLIYWILRLIVNIFLFPYGARALSLYLCSYFYFAILISDNKDSFEVYSDIDNSIYEKIYKIYNPDCDNFSLLKYVLQMVSKFSFVYLIEITMIIILCNGIKNYSSLDNVNLQSFMCILNFTMIFIICVWSFTKYYTFVKPLDDRYDILSIAINKLANNSKSK
jgi:hypothetical protein